MRDDGNKETRKSTWDGTAHFSADHPQEIVRSILQSLRGYFSDATIIETVKKVTGKRPFGPRNLGPFLRGERKELFEEQLDLFRRTWVRSPLGRCLRSFNSSASSLEKLYDALASGHDNRPLIHEEQPIDFDGSYFMYHGSYIFEKEFVIRYLKIETVDNCILTVTDKILDRLDNNKELEAKGVLTFAGDKAQMLLVANERKVGLSLHSALVTRPNVVGKMEWMLGKFFVLTDKSAIADRWFLIVREDTAGEDRKTIEHLLNQTGAFTKAAVIKNKKHADAFRRLARHAKGKEDIDPIFSF